MLKLTKTNNASFESLIEKRSFNWARLKGHLFEEEWAEIFFAEIEKWQ